MRPRGITTLAAAIIVAATASTVYSQDEKVEGSHVTPKQDESTKVSAPMSRIMTTDQREALTKHRDAVREKHDALNKLLVELSPEYAELSEKKGKTRDDRRRLIEIRRKLMQESEEVKSVVKEMDEIGQQFRDQNPQIGAAYRAQGRKVRENRRNMRDEIDKLLAAESPEFAALIEKADKTSEDQSAIRRMRRELMRTSDAAKKIRQQRLETLQKKIAPASGVKAETLPEKAIPEGSSTAVPTAAAAITQPPATGSTLEKDASDVPPAPPAAE